MKDTKKDRQTIVVPGKGQTLPGTASPKPDFPPQTLNPQKITSEISDKKRLEIIAESESKFRSLYEDAPLGYQSLDEDGKILEVNKTWLEMLGYSKEDVVGRWFGDFLTQDGKGKFRERFPLFKEKGEVHGVELDMVRKDGPVLKVSFDGRIACDENGNFRQTHCIISNITENARFQEDLKRAEERYRNLVEQIPVVVYIDAIDDESSTIYISPQVENLLGYTQKEWVSDRGLWSRLLHPDDRNSALDENRRTNETGDSFKLEYRMIARDGRTVWIRDEATLLRDAAEKPLYWQGVMVDITARKKAESERIESEGRYSDIFEGVEDGIIHYDKGVITAVNPKFVQITGLKPEEVVGKTPDVLVRKFVKPKDILHVLNVVKSVISGNQESIFELEYEGKTLEISVPKITLGGSITGIIRDATERKKAEEALKESEERLRIIFESAPDAIYLNDMDGRLVNGNAEAERITGYSRKDLVGKSLLDLLSDPEDASKAAAGIALNAQGKSSGRMELSLRRVDGSSVTVEVEAFPIKVQGQSLCLGIARDITQQKKAEESLREKEHFLSSLVESIPNMIFVKDVKELRFVKFNKAGEDLLGYPRSALLGKNDYDFFPKEQADSFTHKDREVLEGGKLLDIPEEPIKTTRGLRTLHTRKIPILDEKGAPQYLLGISEDITERKLLEDAIKESERSLRELYASMNEGLAIHELVLDDKGVPVDYRIVDVNPAYEKITGISAQKAKNALSHIVYGTETPPYLDIYAKVALTGEAHTFETYFPPIKKHFMISAFSPSKNRFVTVFNDITEKRRTEEAMKESENKFRTIFDSASDGIILTDLETNKFFLVNDTICKMLGYSLEEMLNLSVVDIHPKEALQFIFEQMSNPSTDKTLPPSDLPVKRKDGSILYASVTGREVTLHGKKYSLGMFRDITDRKKMENEIKERLNELEKFHKVAVDREFKMVELKKRIEELEGKK